MPTLSSTGGFNSALIKGVATHSGTGGATQVPAGIITLPGGTILKGDITQIDSRGNAVLLTPKGEIALQTDLTIKLKSEVVIRMINSSAGLKARIISVNGQTPAQLQQSGAEPRGKMQIADIVDTAKTATKPVAATNASPTANMIPLANSTQMTAQIAADRFAQFQTPLKAILLTRAPNLPQVLQSLPSTIAIPIERLEAGSSLRVRIIPQSIVVPQATATNMVPASISPTANSSASSNANPTAAITPTGAQVALANSANTTVIVQSNASATNIASTATTSNNATISATSATGQPSTNNVATGGSATLTNNVASTANSASSSVTTTSGAVTTAATTTTNKATANTAINSSSVTGAAGTNTTSVSSPNNQATISPQTTNVGTSASAAATTGTAASSTNTATGNVNTTAAATTITAQPTTTGSVPTSGAAPAVTTQPFANVATLAQGQISALVLGHESSGQTVLKTSLGTIKLTIPTPQTAGIAGSAASSLPVGTQITLALDSITPRPTAAAANALIAATGTSQPASISELSADWQSLRQSLDIITQTQPAIAAQIIDAVIPKPGPKMATATLFFLSAMRGGDVRQWLGEKGVEALEQANRGDLIRKLGGEFSNMRQFFNDSANTNWQGLFMPVYHEDQLRQAQLFIRKEPGSDADGNPKGTRFVMEVSLTHLGQVQLDGLVRKQRGTMQFDLIMRTQTPINENDREQIRTLYRDAAEITGFKGGINFQISKPFPVRPMQEVLADIPDVMA